MVKIRAIAILLCGTAAVGTAGTLELGAEALRVGDRESAQGFYTQARSSQDPRERSLALLGLGRTALRGGDAAAAEAALNEFKKEQPGGDCGDLPGRIAMAKGDFAGAIRFFDERENNSSLPREAQSAAALAGAYAKLASGDAREAAARFDRAAQKYGDIAGVQAHLGGIYARLRGNNPNEADAALREGKFREHAPELWSALELLSLVQKRRFDEFYPRWAAVREVADRSGESPIFFELARSGAQLAGSINRRKEAEQLWSDAFVLADNDLERRAVLRDTAEFQSGFDPARAAATLHRNLELYPDDPARGDIELRRAGLLARAGEFKAAAESYWSLANDQSLNTNLRRNAAMEGAVAADKSGDKERSSQLFSLLLELSQTPAEKQQGNYFLGIQRYNSGDYAAAVQAFAAAAESDGNYREDADYWLMRAQLSGGDFAAASRQQQKLLNAAKPQYRQDALYYGALILEKSGKTDEALKQYSDFLAAAPDSEFVSSAEFAMAKLNFDRRNFAAARDRFIRWEERFGEQSPAGERALFMAMQSAYFSNDSDTVKKLLERYSTRYPDSVGNAECRLQLVDYMLADRKYTEAGRVLEQLATLKRYADSPEIQAETGYDRARIMVATGQFDAARDALNQLLEKFPDCRVAADCAMMMGDLEADSGHYAAAIAHYTDARQKRPDGAFGRRASGRIADCRYSLCTEKFDAMELDAAKAEYQALCAADDPVAKLQSFYKLGRCLELGGDETGALECYFRTLYLAMEQRRNGISPDSSWCAKAGYAAARGALKSNSVNGGKRALAALRILDRLGIAVNGEFDTIRREIQQKYQLQER